MDKEKVVMDTYQRLKEMGVDTSSQLEIIYALTLTIEQYRDKLEESCFKEDVRYLCDRRACDVCDANCTHTTDITHAENYQKIESTFFERLKQK